MVINVQGQFLFLWEKALNLAKISVAGYENHPVFIVLIFYIPCFDQLFKSETRSGKKILLAGK
jgi:hypothetical protein